MKLDEDRRRPEENTAAQGETPADDPAAQVQRQAQKAVQRETAPPQTRRRRSQAFQAYLIAAIAAFGVLAYFANTLPYFAIDLAITRQIQAYQPAWFDALMSWISWPGYAWQSVLITAIATLLLLALGLRREALMAAASSASAAVLNILIKLAIQRPRPSADLVNVVQNLKSYSFPSGHVMFYLAFFGFLWYVCFSLLKPSWGRAALLAYFGAMVLLVGVSRVYLGEHWASDVLGGYLLGGALLECAILVYIKIKGENTTG